MYIFIFKKLLNRHHYLNWRKKTKLKKNTELSAYGDRSASRVISPIRGRFEKKIRNFRKNRNIINIAIYKYY